MKPILDALLAALSRGETCVLCTVLASSGSAPRGAGARMAVFADGKTVGTVGGGAVELQCTRRAQEAIVSGGNDLCSYDLRPNDVSDIGMICGGCVTVYFQRFSPENGEELAVLRRARALLEEDGDLWLVLELDESRVRSFRVLTRGELPTDERRALFSARALWRDGLYIEPIARAGKVCIFGGGHVGRALVPVLKPLGFRVVLFDDRAALAKKENYPAADEVIFGSFSDIFARVTLGENDYAVVMTPGHQADYEILAQVLKTDASYIGCIGSRGKIAKTHERLLADGFTESDFARIHAPIGLPILAETPEEIAVSVAAELIEHRARRAKGER